MAEFVSLVSSRLRAFNSTDSASPLGFGFARLLRFIMTSTCKQPLRLVEAEGKRYDYSNRNYKCVDLIDPLNRINILPDLLYRILYRILFIIIM